MRSGIQKSRIEDITAASGLSKGAFYLHFKSKEALFRELVKELEAHFEEARFAREKAWGGLMRRGMPAPRNQGLFVVEVLAIEGGGDRQLLEVLWRWRDVIDVLLRGSQGTEFEQVMWTMLDREVARVERQCAPMLKAGLMRPDVPSYVIGSMIVGTYLLAARRMSKLRDKPDFEPWVRSLQNVIVDGVSSGSLRVQRDAAMRRAR